MDVEKDPRAELEGQRQSDRTATRWAFLTAGGVQALGFSPTPMNPNGAAGLELGLVRKGVYQFRVGGELGFYSQVELTNAVTLDVPLINRLTSKWGLYGDVEVVVGGELSWINTPTYQGGQGESVARSSSPVKPNGRVGLGLAAGLDLRRLTSIPLRVFLRYRQYVLVPYMPMNEVPVMGLSSLSLGIAWEMGS